MLLLLERVVLEKNALICEKSYCKELDNITLTNEELLFLANKLLHTNGNNYFIPNFHEYPLNLVRKLEIYKKLFLQKNKNPNMNLNEFYNMPYNEVSGISNSFLMTKISNDKSYKYNKSAINTFENIFDTVNETGSLTSQQAEYFENINDEINFWKEKTLIYGILSKKVKS